MDTVLLVDDDPAIREIFSVYLGREGFAALAVSGGAECLGLLNTRPADAILLDMMMEPMDGWDTLLALHNNPVTREIPVIIMTGKHPTHGDLIRYGGLIEDFIIKPVDAATVAASLHGIIARSRDVQAEAAQRVREGHDPVLVTEYIRLARMVRIAHNLILRFRGIPWVDQALLERQEQELLRLHRKLGFPDRLLVREKVFG